MAININHVTNDLSATSGKVTVCGPSGAASSKESRCNTSKSPTLTRRLASASKSSPQPMGRCFQPSRARARESQYPTEVPEFFGTCPDDADTQIDGVLGVYLQADWETMREDEMRTRNPVPQQVTMRQARLELPERGLLDDVEAVIASAGRAAQIEWEFAETVARNHPVIAVVQAQQGLTDAQIDDMFLSAAKR